MNKLLLFASDCKCEPLEKAFQMSFTLQITNSDYKSVVQQVLEKQTQCVYVSENSLKAQIIFNKFENIRAAICYNQYMVQMCREHNDANVLIIPLDNIAMNVALDFPLAVSTEFDTKTTVNHQRRVNKLNLVKQ